MDFLPFCGGMQLRVQFFVLNRPHSGKQEDRATQGPQWPSMEKSGEKLNISLSVYFTGIMILYARLQITAETIAFVDTLKARLSCF